MIIIVLIIFLDDVLFNRINNFFHSHMPDDVNLELSKILSKVMQSSYKRKEINERIERIIGRIGNEVGSDKKETAIRSLRLQFEEIRKDYYNL